MKFNKKFFIFISLVLIFGMSFSYAIEVNDSCNNDMSEEILFIENSSQKSFSNYIPENFDNNDEIINSIESDNILQDDESDEIVVENWDELQYYCSLKDKDYTLKLKENTNFYPTKPTDYNYQIKVYNNVKIIGSNGSYIGYDSSNAPIIKYASIVVPDNYKSSIYLENITFKWISVNYGTDGIFLQIGGKKNSIFKNCNFIDVKTTMGHSCIVHLKKGTTTLDNCSFINCTNDYGCISVYGNSPHMIVRDSYFENNYARTEPGCINNCGKLTVYNTTFIKNRSFWWAGAIHTHSGANTTIYDSNFIDNVAGWNGGALYTYSYLQIYNSIFVGNNCTTNSGGGAIGACSYGSDPHIYIENSLFERNENLCWSLDSLSTKGTGAGGAIAIMDKGSLSVLNSTFISNAAAHGAAISASAAGEYGSPNVVIAGNSFINHTRVGDVLRIGISGTVSNLYGNYFDNNCAEISYISLSTLSSGKDYATLQVDMKLSRPQDYDLDIYDKMSYHVYVNGEYVKTVSSPIFTVDFDDLDIFDVYVIPSITNQKSNELTVSCIRDYIYVSKSRGNDSFDGLSRELPVNSIKRALELAGTFHNIVLLDGFYDEGKLQIDYDLMIKGEKNSTLTNTTSFIVNSNNFTLKNMKILNLNGDVFINQEVGNIFIINCVFNGNDVSRIIDANSTDIVKSIFVNNKLLVWNKGFVRIKNSVLLNNTKIVDNNMDNVDLDYNWWGNVLNDVSKPIGLSIGNWLIFNVSCSNDCLEYGQSNLVKFELYLFEDGKISKYDDLVKFYLNIDTFNGTTNINSVKLNSNVIFTQTGFSDGILLASYNDISLSLAFKFLKSNPNINIKYSNIQFGQDLVITVVAPEDIINSKGSIKINVGENYITKTIKNGAIFTFSNLEAKVYDVVAIFSGNDQYSSQRIESKVEVNKYSSSTKISVGDCHVGDDLAITVTTNKNSDGNITLLINDFDQTLNLTNNKVTYIFKNVSRGDYHIKAIYNGNEKYLGSQDSLLLEVDNLNSTMSVFIENSTYGDVAIVDVLLNDDAEGVVSVNVDGIFNSSRVIDGKSKVYIYGVEVGVNHKVNVFYSGDNNYLNKTIFSYMNVSKADFSFNISSEDIYIGHDAVITIIVPSRTTGNFTINDVVLSIPLSGEVTYVIPDLGVGNYTFTAEYNGNNYFTVRNSTSFTVFEYPHAQWANDGADTENTQKTDYAAVSNGAVSWVNQVNSTVITNIVIDSEGNLYIATNTGIYSYGADGSLRWIYESDGRIGNFSGLSLGRDVIISPKAGDTIYLIRNTLNLVNQTTGEKYGNSNIYQASSIFVPVIDSNANIYTVSEYQFEAQGYNLVITPFKIWEGGGSPIQIKMGTVKPITAPSFNSDVIAVLCEGTLMIIDVDTLKVTSMKNGNFKNVRPVIGDGNIIYTIVGDSVYAFSTSGSSLWNNKIPGGSGDHLLLDNDLGLYVTNAEGKLYMFDLFTHEANLISDLSITSGVLIDANHNLYFGCDNMFYAIDSTGSVLWKTDLESKITGSPVMNKDGVIYVATEDSKLFALGNLTGSSNNTNSTPTGNGTNVSGDTNSTPTGNGTNVSGDTNSTRSNPTDESGTNASTNPSSGGSDTNAKAIKNASKITAKKKTFKRKTKVKKYTITLKSGKNPIKNVKVTIKVGKKTYSAKTNAKGKATFKIKKLTKKGKYTAKIKFKGNKSFKPTTKKVKIVVK